MFKISGKSSVNPIGMKRLIVTLFLLSPIIVSSQKLRITSIDVSGGRLVVEYLLEDNNQANLYQVNLYASADNYAQPLTKVSGDIGVDIKPGSKKIEWQIIEELGALEGEIAVEVRARVHNPFLKVASIDAGRKFKRGNAYPLVWTSGNMGGQVDIDLFNGKERVKSDRNIPNTGKYEWYIDGSLKPGSDYHLRFTNTRNRDEFIDSNVFSIIPKIPMLAKIGAVVAVGGGVAAVILLLDDEPTGSDPLEELNKELPGND